MKKIKEIIFNIQPLADWLWNWKPYTYIVVDAFSEDWYSMYETEKMIQWNKHFNSIEEAKTFINKTLKEITNKSEWFKFSIKE